jgi:hypothetical protein
MRLQKHPHCLNCGFRVEDFNFCPECGQPNTDRKLTLWQFIRDFFDDYFTFDSRFFRSVGPLVIKPGHLTREYLDGRRFRYILPLRLYLFTTFLFFFILAAQTKMQSKRDFSQSKPLVTEATLDSVSAILKENETQLSPEITAYLNEAMKLAERETDAWDKESNKVKVAYKDSTDNWFTRLIETKVRYLVSKGKEGGQIFAKEVVEQIPKIMFLLLPIFALILKLLYVRRKYLFVEHLIFALHIHTLVFLLVLVAILIPKWYIISSMALLIFIQLFRALRRVYQQSIPKTLFKMFLLVNMYGFALMIASGLLALLALAMV